MPELEILKGTRFGVIADAHIHPGKTPPLPGKLKEIFAGVDAIFALGDMGESAGFDWLESIAPVRAVRGADDPASDARVPGALRLFAIGLLSVGAMFDGVEQGLFAANDPLALSPHFEGIPTRVFGRRPDVLLCASTHKSYAALAHGILVVNPGSPTLADTKSVAVLHVANALVRVEHATLG